jgi:hypothetical protein
MTDNEPTRILRGQPEPEESPAADGPEEVARGLAGGAAGTPGDKIVFTCPNGHRIVVGREFAGKRGKCSKCGVDVRIPGAGPGKAAAPPQAVPEPALPAATGADTVGDPPPVEAEGPPAEAAVPPPIPADQPPPDGGTAPAAEPAADWGFVAGAADGSGGNAGGWPALDADGLLDDEAANPTAHLVARLWAERQHGGVIELHITGGSVILPSYFDPAWSRGSHGLFAREELDGSYTITAIAWDTVQKVVVRQLTAVPPDMFP